MYLAAVENGGWVRTADVARAFKVSVHHLQKAAQGLVRGGYVEAQQGRSGGVRLSADPATLRLGALVSRLEGAGCLVDCARGPCPLAGRCALKIALDAAEGVFFRELDKFTLADAISGPTGTRLKAMLDS